MKLRRGISARITLVDGTTIEGTPRFTFAWWVLRLVDVTAHSPRGAAPAAGEFIVPKRSILFVQVVDHG